MGLIVSKEYLHEQYIVLGKTAPEIANELKCNPDIICSRLKKYKLYKRNLEENLTGLLFGRLFVFKKMMCIGKSKYFCLCECGNIVHIPAMSLKNNSTKSCGCLRKETAKYGRWKGCGEFDGRIMLDVQNNGKRRGLDVDIDIKYLWDLFLKQDRKCALSGIDLTFASVTKRKIGETNTVSVDRINSDEGYISGNIQLVHKHINIMKLDYTLKEFIEMCQDIYDYQKFMIAKVVPALEKSNHPLCKWHGEIRCGFFNNLLFKAKARNIYADIDINELNDLFIKQNKRCVFSGRRLYFGGQSLENTVSVDRIDSSKGYTIDNTQFVHKDINMIKQSYSQQYFLDLCFKIAKWTSSSNYQMETV